MEATHFLESQGQASSAESKSSSPWKPLTSWRAKDRCCQQGQNPAHHRSRSQTGEPRMGIISRVKIQLTMEANSQTGEPRTGIVSRVKLWLTTEATHQLESQGQVLSAGLNSSSPQKPLTSWRAKDGHCQQGQNPAHNRSHSLSGEPRTDVVSMVEIQFTTEATHSLD